MHPSPKHIITLLLILFASKTANTQSVAPQIWSNVYVLWDIDDRFNWNNNLEYDVLLSEEFPWNSLSFSSSFSYRFHPYIQASAGLYLARTQQSLTLSSFETRPFLALLLNSNPQNRYIFINISRLEWRNFIFSDGEKVHTGRFRNRTYASISLNQRAINANKNLFLYGYFEVFLNFDDDVRERFFNLFKYKLGLGYRLNDNWIFSIGGIYQDAQNNVPTPVQLPTNIITNYIFEWAIGYVIHSDR